jgi:putative endopeptidase
MRPGDLTQLGTNRKASPKPVSAQDFDLAGMDRSVKPGDDFFRYANGAWFDKAVIPSDRASTGSFLELEIQSEDRVRRHSRRSETGDTLSAEGESRNLYRSFVDTRHIEALG